MTRNGTIADEKRGHTPVMEGPCLTYLDVREGAWYVDGTFGAGGHTRALLARGARVLAIDQDPNALVYQEGLADRTDFVFARGNFREMERLASDHGVQHAAGVLLDLGVSSMQLDEAERGFAFRHDGPLDMRMSDEGLSAADVVNEAPMEEIAAILWRFGEERYSRKVARRIVEERDRAPILTTQRLAAVVATAYPPGPRRSFPARRTFQALRIHVNDELGALQEGLEAGARLLAPGGRLVILSYHSLEDRIVKRFLSDSPRMRALTKKPLEASADEVEANPRARSAKLRAGERTSA